MPALVSEDAYRRHLAHICKGLNERTMRTFASLAIARSVRAGTWDECAELFGWESHYVRGVVNNAVVKLNRVDGRDEFWVAIAAIKNEMAAGELIDYRAREQRFAAWELISVEEWTRIRRECGMRDDVGGARRRNASAWLWSRLTGMHWSDAPALGGNASESNREVFRRFSRDLLPALGPHLVESAERLVASVPVEADAASMAVR